MHKVDRHNMQKHTSTLKTQIMLRVYIYRSRSNYATSQKWQGFFVFLKTEFSYDF